MGFWRSDVAKATRCTETTVRSLVKSYQVGGIQTRQTFQVGGSTRDLDLRIVPQWPGSATTDRQAATHPEFGAYASPLQWGKVASISATNRQESEKFLQHCSNYHHTTTC